MKHKLKHKQNRGGGGGRCNCPHLACEAGALLDRVVELRVGVAHLVVVGKELKALGEAWVLAMVLG
jgi:hypothetical protein